MHRETAYLLDGTLSTLITGFVQYARRNGLNAGIQETLDALEASRLGALQSIPTLRYALQALMCSSVEELPKYNRLFDYYFLGIGQPEARSRVRTQGRVDKKTINTLVLMGSGNQSAQEEEESKNVTGANRVERIRKTDFTKVSEIDGAFLEEIAQRLWQQLSHRLKKRMKQSSAKGRLDLRRTIRENIKHGGSPVELKWSNNKPRKQKLVILLDVSGSMDKYSFYLLKFLIVLKAHFKKIEAFLFSTHLVRATELLQTKNLAQVLAELSEKADNWSSGTRIGECFQTFNEQYPKRVLYGQPVVIILSDGLDTGDPALLAEALAQIHRRAKKLIWLNPLKGTKDYSPTAKGMQAALPEIDVFESAHNLDSILELEKFLSYA